ncbi:uncharacterized protein LOC134245617 isoform X2 [Saccostrea cucullata]|uniref:uncharacterized protein LOC134245617 isoform X2 n=1 Tax=Saccostrea cuccullata TaxID=36930 RepID=UPI002ED591E5
MLICVFLTSPCAQVSDVAHGPLFFIGTGSLCDFHDPCQNHKCQVGQKAVWNIFKGSCDCYCTGNRGCSYLGCPHPYCTQFFGIFSTCHCGECTTDRHCKCGVGETGKCNIDYRHHPTHFCECLGSSSTVRTTPPTTKTTPTTTKTTPTTTKSTTALPLVRLECHDHKIGVIEAIAENVHVQDHKAAVCPNNKHESSEAYIINKCNTTRRSHWRKGSSIKTECEKGHRITPYTPISTFLRSGENIAGFFISCNKQGFKMAAQSCTDAPMVTNVTQFTIPHLTDFYTILLPTQA